MRLLPACTLLATSALAADVTLKRTVLCFIIGKTNKSAKKVSIYMLEFGMQEVCQLKKLKTKY